MCQFDDFTKSLRRACEKKQLTQRELASRSGVHYVTVSKILSGKMSNPSLGIVEKLADAAGLRIKYTVPAH